MKVKKVLSLIIFMFFFSSLLNNWSLGNAYASAKNPFDVTIAINGKNMGTTNEVNLKNGQEVKFDIHMKRVGMVGENYEYKIKIPDCFKGITIKDLGSLERAFNVKVEGNTIILKANDNANKIVGAYLRIETNLDCKKGGDTLNTDINLNGKSIPLKVNIEKPVQPKPVKPDEGHGNKPDEGGTINHIEKLVNGEGEDRIGTIDSSTNTLNYSVKLDTHKMNGEIKFSDTMPEGVTLSKSSIKVVQVKNGVQDITSELGRSLTITSDNNTLVIKGFKPDNIYYVNFKGIVSLDFAKDKYYYSLTNVAYLNQYSSSAIAIINTVKKKITPYDQAHMITKYSSTGEFHKVGDSIGYRVYVNPNYNRLTNAVIVDKLPKDLLLDPKMDGFDIFTQRTGGSTYYSKYNIYKISKDGKTIPIKKISNALGSVYYNLKDNEIKVEAGNTHDRLYIDYKAVVNNIDVTINNVATVTYNGLKSSDSSEIKFNSDAGSMLAWKTVNKQTLIDGENPIVQYELHIESYGVFPKNYVAINDTLESGMKLLSIEGVDGHIYKVTNNKQIIDAKSGFIYTIDGNKITAVNKNVEISPNKEYIIKINCSLANFKDGTTIYNQAYVNGVPTVKVSTKKGYAFTATKVDGKNTKDVLQGAVFNLYSASDNKLLETLTSDKNGKIGSSIKSPGKYYLVEETAPNGYVVNNNKIPFEVTEGDIGQTINIGNISDIKKPTKIEVKKVSENGEKALKGAVFTIYDSNNKIVKEMTTGENGMANAYLNAGKYTIEETKAPVGYENSGFKENFTVSYGEVKPIEFTAKDTLIPTKGNIKIVKVNNENKPLEGAKFSLMKDGKEVSQGITNAQGILEFNNIEQGEYNLIENSAPMGYVEANSQNVVVKPSETSKVNIVDKTIKGQIKVIKEDGKSNKPLEGAEFNIINKSTGKIVDTVLTGKNGEVLSQSLPFGVYIVKEVKAPGKYELNSIPQEISIVTNNEVKDVIFKDTLIPVKSITNTITNHHTPKYDNHTPKENVPKVNVPKVNVPKVNVPKVNVPKVNVQNVTPKINVPKQALKVAYKTPQTKIIKANNNKIERQNNVEKVPKTGESSLIPTVMLLVVSIILLFLVNKKGKKELG